ncbi:M48 family metalloprotease [Arhodomonas aquaeolei]|uniref:beta-barrel assembly-enhancing protease n=1 Tax=Arhodomonas aquaeolei TaxID=2369 RepID=UPI00037C2B31|nr:M48 family metalloprotease [Arhodomonas aquaeolei]
MARTLLRALIIATGIAAAAPAGAALDLSLPDMGDPADQVMTPAREREIGQRMMGEIRREASLVDDPPVIGYIHDLGVRLAGYSGGASDGFSFFLIDDPRINAFAMPGGYIGINTGLFLAAQSESELASVLAHEMTHVTQRHLARRILAAQGSSLRTMAMILAGILIGTQDPQAGSAAAMSGMASAAQSQLAYSREHEHEADRIGEELLARAGFDPHGMPRFFGRLLDASRYSATPPPFLSTHPLTEERIAESRQRADDLASSQGRTFESASFALMHARLAAITAHSGNAAVERLRGQLEDGEATRAEHYGLAVALIRADDLDAARKELDSASADGEERAAYYLTRADIARAAEQPAQAISILEEGLSLFPDDYALEYRRIQALSAAGRHQDALNAVAAATERHPWSDDLLRLHARTADAAGHGAEASLAMARFYAARGDLRSALHQIDDVLSSPAADGYQRSRARALQQNWQQQISGKDGEPSSGE